MIFRFLTLYLERTEINFSNDEAYPFYLKSRSLCDFIERHLNSLKIKTDGFNQLDVRAFKADPPAQVYVDSSQVLCVQLRVDSDFLPNIKAMDKKEINEFYISFLNQGMAATAEFDYQYPRKEIEEAVERFRAGDYVNRWVFKRKRITGRKAYCVLECDIDTEHFRMDLVVLRDEIEIYRQNVVTDEPNSMITDRYFGTLEVVGDEVVVRGKLKKVLYTENLAHLF